MPFARRDYRILCVELGDNLAAVARHNLRAYPEAEVRTGAFEAWPVEEAAFDLAISATAFHWLDPEIAYPKAAHALKPGGAIALFWNLHVQSEADQGFFEEVQKIYERETPELTGDYTPLRRPDDEPEPVREEIERTGLFGPVAVRRYPWDQAYDAASYIRVLDTYSGHRNLDPRARERLYQSIAHLIDTSYNGRITKGYLTILYVAERK